MRHFWLAVRLAIIGLVAAAPVLAAPPDQTPAAPMGKPAGAAPTTQVAAVGIMGRAVSGPDGQQIGRVVDVLVDAGSNPRAAVIDFGGFLGVGDRRVAVAWSDLQFPAVGITTESTTNIRLDLTADQIKSAPSYTDQAKPAAVVIPPPAPSPLAKSPFSPVPLPGQPVPLAGQPAPPAGQPAPH